MVDNYSAHVRILDSKTQIQTSHTGLYEILACTQPCTYCNFSAGCRFAAHGYHGVKLFHVGIPSRSSTTVPLTGNRCSAEGQELYDERCFPHQLYMLTT